MWALLCSKECSQHFILPNSAYLLGIKHKEGKKECPKSELGKTQAVQTEGKERKVRTG